MVAHRVIPLAIGGLLLGLPFLAEGIQNPPTLEEVKATGLGSPTVKQLFATGQLLGLDVTHVFLFHGREYRAWGSDVEGEISRESGLWQLQWNFTVQGAGVLVEQLISDRTGRLLWEGVRGW